MSRPAPRAGALRRCEPTTTLIRCVPFLFFLLNSLLTSCAGGLGTVPNDTTHVEKAVQVSRDTSTGWVFYHGPVVTQEAEPEGFPEVGEISLHANTNRLGDTRYFLTVDQRYRGHWRGAIHAADDEGHEFLAYSLRQGVECEFNSEFQDAIVIELEGRYLTDHKHKGITLHLLGPNGSVSTPFTLTPAYIQGFLLKIGRQSS